MITKITLKNKPTKSQLSSLERYFFTGTLNAWLKNNNVNTCVYDSSNNTFTFKQGTDNKGWIQVGTKGKVYSYVLRGL